MNNKLLVLCTGWGLLGGYRNVSAVEYERKKKLLDIQNEIKSYTDSNYYKNTIQNLQMKEQRYKNKMYSDLMFHFLGGMILYGNPFTGLLYLPNELYRLEVDVRGIEDEKKSERYNKTLF